MLIVCVNCIYLRLPTSVKKIGKPYRVPVSWMPSVWPVWDTVGIKRLGRVVGYV
jgi:hypothetical protein